MGRVLFIIGLVGVLLAAGVAVASPADQIRLPVTMSPPPKPGAGPTSVVVERGDHLWKISESHLGPEATAAEVVPYWLEVIDVNTPGLRSGDPDLIYPGEVIELPAASEPR
jgi:nucleoid-associated protein YgaU